MRNSVCLLFFLALLSGCAKHSPAVYDPVLSLYVQPGVYRQVSEGLADEFSVKQDLAVSGWSLENWKNWERFSSDAVNWLELSRASANAVYLTDKLDPIQVKDTLWTFYEDVKWPSKDLMLTFLAYSPYKAPCECSLEHGVSWRVDDIMNEQVDLLYADMRIDNRTNFSSNVLNLCFEHALCRIDFRIKNRVDNDGDASLDKNPDEIRVKSISIDDVKYSGSFRSRSQQQWDLRNDTRSLPIYSGEGFQTTGNPEPVGESWLMLPQALNTYVTVEFEYINFDGGTISQTLQTASPLKTVLQPGYNYTYTLSVGIDDVLFLQEVIEEEMRNDRK